MSYLDKILEQIESKMETGLPPEQPLSPTQYTALMAEINTIPSFIVGEEDKHTCDYEQYIRIKNIVFYPKEGAKSIEDWK